MYVIAGVTGNTGSIAAQTLLDAGENVRVIVRNPEKGQIWKDKGADVAIADLFDEKAVRDALIGAKGAYFLLPPELSSERFLSSRRELADQLVNIISESQLEHVVFLSSVGAQLEEKTGPILTLAYLEKLLEKSPVKTTALRPGYFLDNWGSVLPAAINDGVLPSFLQPLDQKIDMVATQDIGKTAAQLLLEGPATDGQAHRIVELKGHSQYSAHDIAQSLSKALNKDITPIAVPQSTWKDTFMQFGISNEVAGLFADMYENINNATITYEEINVRHGDTSLDQFIQNLTK